MPLPCTDTTSLVPGASLALGNDAGELVGKTQAYVQDRASRLTAHATKKAQVHTFEALKKLPKSSSTVSLCIHNLLEEEVEQDMNTIHDDASAA